jgi:hypothetical protein
MFVALFFQANVREIDGGRYELRMAIVKLDQYANPANAAKLAELQGIAGPGGAPGGQVPSAPKADIEPTGQYL